MKLWGRSSKGLTLFELLIVLLIVMALVVLALTSFLRHMNKTRSTEALSHLYSIRVGELLYRDLHGSFAEALDIDSLNTKLDIGLTPRYYDYSVSRTGLGFLAKATPKFPSGEPIIITMDQEGSTNFSLASLPAGGGRPVTYHPPIAGGASGLGSGGTSVSGGGGIPGGSSSSGSGGFSSGSSSSSSGGSNSSGGESGSTGTGSGSSSSSSSSTGSDPVLTFIDVGEDRWSGWPDSTATGPNIVGTVGIGVLQQTFDWVAQSQEFRSIADDLAQKGIPIFFGDPADFGAGNLYGNSIASFVGDMAWDNYQPNPPPDDSTYIVFNPAYLNDNPLALAAVLVHEGTHFQDYLDMDPQMQAYSSSLSARVDIEFSAWWNEAAFWQDVKQQAGPIDTPLEDQVQRGAYEHAIQGEAALRDFIAGLYS